MEIAILIFDKKIHIYQLAQANHPLYSLIFHFFSGICRCLIWNKACVIGNNSSDTQNKNGGSIMKKITAIVSIFVLTATVFTACRNRNQPLETTRPTTAPVTQETTVPTTQATQPSTTSTMPSETRDTGNGPLDSTSNTEATDHSNTTEDNSRSRRMMPTPGT